MNQWQNTSDEIVKSLPFHVAEWLLEFGSLTEKLERAVGDKVKIEVLKESVEIASEKEAVLLDMAVGNKIWSREVLLFGKNTPWIYAKTLVPISSAHLIQELGQKPLGSILFSEKQLTRQMLKVRKLDSAHHLYQSAKNNHQEINQNLWARRSLWQNPEQADIQLLVSEVFLPDSPLYKK